MTNSKPTILQALNAAMLEMGNPGKDGKNPHFNSEYATLAAVHAAIKPPLARHGLTFRQAIQDGYMTVTVTDGEDEKLLEARPFVPAGNAQQQGSSESYAKRYQLLTVFALAPADDDGNAAAAAGDPFDVAKRVAWTQMLQAEGKAREAGITPERPDLHSIPEIYRYIDMLDALTGATAEQE